MDLSKRCRIHVVAVGGAGMSAIATLLAEGGHVVSGSDLQEGPALPALRELGVRVVIGHDASNLGTEPIDGVLVSTAVPENNPEVLEARRRSIPVLNRREFLPSFAAIQPLISVSGTHGKTTTSSLLAVALQGAGADPSFLVGAPVPVLGGAAGLRSGRNMVLEADESDGSFLAGPRAAAVLTNAEPDHLEFWGGWDELRAGFVEFLRGTQGPTVVCSDDPGSAAIGLEAGAATYGIDLEADYRLNDLVLNTAGSEFLFGTARVRIQLPGKHNALNACAALATVAELGLDVSSAADSLAGHDGLYRRFERRGEADGVVVIDDYAHLPAEVEAALSAAKNSGWKRVVAVFQPHRFSRTQAVGEDLGAAFGDADELILTEIFPAGEQPRPGVNGRVVFEAAAKARLKRNQSAPLWAATLQDVAVAACEILRPGDVFLTVGAGDVRTVGDVVLNELNSRSSKQ